VLRGLGEAASGRLGGRRLAGRGLLRVRLPVRRAGHLLEQRDV